MTGTLAMFLTVEDNSNPSLPGVNSLSVSGVQVTDLNAARADAKYDGPNSLF